MSTDDEQAQSTQQYVLEAMLFSVGPVTALIAARCGLRSWLKYEAFYSFLIGIVLFFKPSWILSIILNTPITDWHVYLSALNGCYLIWSVLYPMLLHNSQDDGIYYGHFWGRIIGCTMIIVDTLYARKETDYWNYKLICLVTSFAIFNLLINAYYLAKCRQPSGIMNDPVNQIAKFDFYLLLLSSIVMYAFPDQFTVGLVGSNSSYRSLARFGGAVIFSLGFESFFVAEFVYLIDKRKFMLSRLLGSLLELVFITLGYAYFRVLGSDGVGFLVPLNIFYDFVCLYGFCITKESRFNIVAFIQNIEKFLKRYL